MNRYWKEQLDRYPDMQIQDFVKFLYQATLGPAHLIENKVANYQYFLNEYHNIEKDKSHILIEEISDEYVRIHLEALSEESLDVYYQLFLKSAEVKNDYDTFVNELSLIEKEIIAGNLPFDIHEWKQYLKSYQENDYPMVSHTDNFRNSYHPHYRVIKKQYLIELGDLYENKK